LSEAKAQAEGYFPSVTQEPEKNNLQPEPSGTEQSEPAKAGRGSDRKRLIRRLPARHELQDTANQSLEGSEAGRAGSGEPTAAPC